MCPDADEENRARCVNCKGRHRTSDKSCPRHITNQQILNLAYRSSPPLSFRQAQAQWIEAQKAEVNESRAQEPRRTLATGSGQPTKTYANAIKGKSSRRRPQQSRADAEAESADLIELRKADLQTILTSAVTLNVVTNAVLQQQRNDLVISAEDETRDVYSALMTKHLRLRSTNTSSSHLYIQSRQIGAYCI